MTFVSQSDAIMRKRSRYAHGANFTRHRTHPETGSRFAVIFGAFSGRAGLPSAASLGATQLFVWQREAASVVTHWRSRADCKNMRKSALRELRCVVTRGQWPVERKFLSAMWTVQIPAPPAL